MKRSAAAVVASLTLFAMPASALASGNATKEQYSSAVQSVQAKRTPSSVQNANATRTTSTGSLPFTGLDLGALSAGAVVLLGAGLVLRRVSSDDRS